MAYEKEMQELAKETTQKYGELEEVDCLFEGKIQWIFARKVVPVPVDHIMKFGCLGTGSGCFHAFLTTASFNIALHEIENLKAPLTLFR